ncbi:serine/threonine-protein kinase Nek11-like isoform X2 [Rhinatrema bivittatum]|uniref:serine/threonine-protein kinase Nek11-like isoform X2 n=1 Tax=Rhinatrema bivittatum TaxID=194408 RepID=UPI0011260CD7|nr:serine/threonine-protein kinase Nek11-like isoform X2 [Rhinatrema bivittatum]
MGEEESNIFGPPKAIVEGKEHELKAVHTVASRSLGKVWSRRSMDKGENRIKNAQMGTSVDLQVELAPGSLLPGTQCSYVPGQLVAGRYSVIKRLGSGSFATAYLVSDAQCQKAENEKVLKKIPLGDLCPDATVPSAKEAQLLASLNNPAIIQFFSSFVDLTNFFIVTEYCEGGDLEAHINQRREAGRLFSENQVLEWFIQLLLGIQYLHERLILHRDLKTKNIFLKNGTVKIGDFGVSRILMVPSDLATTFTGTPRYMSPEVFTQNGYNAKSDIWSLGCVLYEICCLQPAFRAHGWMKLVTQIVQGPTPTLPGYFTDELNSIMQRMLTKSPLQRLSASEILCLPYMQASSKVLVCTLESFLQPEDSTRISEETARIAAAMQQKIHLDSLHAALQAQKMRPRERRRVRREGNKENKIKKAVDQLYQENQEKMRQCRRRAAEMHHEESNESQSHESLKTPISSPSSDLLKEIQSDEKSSEGDSDGEEGETITGSLSTLSMPLTEQQSTTLQAYLSCLQRFLETSSTVHEDEIMETLSQDSQDVIVSVYKESKIAQLRQECVSLFGEEAFWKVYSYLKQIHYSGRSDEELQVVEEPQEMLLAPQHCWKVQQLLFLERRIEEEPQGSSAVLL